MLKKREEEPGYIVTCSIVICCKELPLLNGQRAGL